ncbi:MAG: hypothetical protein ACYCW6_20335 [Candidatus Xenobia bacterium]
MEAFADLDQRLLARGLVYGGRPLPTALRPRFITPEQVKQIRQASRALVRACQRIEEMALADERALAQLGLPAAEIELIRYPAPYTTYPAFNRLDGFLSESGIQFVEFNVDSPGGAAFYDAQADVVRRLPIMKRFSREFILRGCRSGPRILDTLLEACARWRSDVKPRIAIVDWTDVSTAAEFRLLAEQFQRRGVPTVIADPRELSYRQGALWARDFPVTIAYKRVVTSELLGRRDDCRDFLAACRDGAVCLVNPFRSKLQTPKSMLAILWDPDWRRHLPRSEQRWIDACIPWTTFLRNGKAWHPRHGIIEIVPFALRNRDHLVIKPNDEYGGSGVTLGWTQTASEWERRIQEGLQTLHVLQEKVAVPTETFPVVHDNRLSFVPFYVDCDPYYFGPRMGTVGTRFSSAQVLNVKAGGGAIPTFVVSPR